MEITNPAPSLQEASHTPSETLLPATLDDVSDIRHILQEASDFKRSQGDDLWGDEPFTNEEVTKMVSSGNMFVYKTDGIAAAAVLLPKEDERMWGEQGADETAVYVHKLCVSNAFRGQSVGKKVMDLAEDFAKQSGRTKLRLDCPYDNPPLCRYYEGLGYREVRKYDRPSSAGRRNPDKDVYRAALYEKSIQ